MMMSEHRLISFDETPIFYRRFKPTATPAKGIVVIQHGMGEHGGRYGHVAAYLANLGLETISMDLRGFGLSGGRRCYARHFMNYCGDLGALHAFISRTNEGTPIFLLGHSFGGLVASAYLALQKHPKINGLILSSPIFGIALTVPGWRHTLGIIGALIFPTFTQSNSIKPPMLTHDTQVLSEYKKDPLIYHYVTARLYKELIFAMGLKKSIAQRIVEPVLVMQAGEDTVVSRQETVNFYELLNTADKELEVYEGFYHEILHEVEREKVLSRMGDWIEKRL